MTAARGRRSTPSDAPLGDTAHRARSSAPTATRRRAERGLGSSLLVDSDKGTLRAAWLNALVDDIAALREAGKDVLVVSSGAIALGRRILGIDAKALRLEDSQAAAAAGQIRLSAAWGEALAKHDLKTAQILLTLGDTESRRHYLNARETVNTLLKFGVVPEE